MKNSTEIKVRLYTYKSFRHYGGREITTTPHICKAVLIEKQQDHSYYVMLTEDCIGFGRKAGSKIAVLEKDFNIN